MVGGSSATRATTAFPTRFAVFAIVVLVVSCSACAQAAVDAASAPQQSRTVAREAARPRRIPSRTEPLRIDVIGDSMAVVLTGGLTTALRAAGAAAPVDRAWWGFGLTSGWTEVRDGEVVLTAEPFFGEWPQHYEQFVAHDDPDAFVVYVGGWDLASRVVNGRVLTPPSVAWRAFYAGLLDRAATILTSKGAIAYFLGPPCDGEGPSESGYSLGGTALLREMFSELAARHPGRVVYLNLAPLLCPSGRSTAYVTTPTGATVRVLDGHFTPAGARLVGAWFVDQTAATWDLRRDG